MSARTVSSRSLSPARAEQAALERLNGLIAEVSGSNEFQRDRLDGVVLRSLDDLRQIRPVDKDDLLRDQQAHPPFGRNLTYPRERYVHLHQTSGTSGSTLRVLDTEDDWDWWRGCLHDVFAAAGVGPDDLVALAYSFGPYVQFWASYEGAGAVGANRIALGGMDSVQRLETIREYSATTLGLHSLLRGPARERSRSEGARGCAVVGDHDHLHGRAGGVAAGGPLADRSAVASQVPRPCRSVRGRRVWVPVRRGRRGTRQRARVRR